MEPRFFLSLTIFIAVLSFLLLFYEKLKLLIFNRCFRKIYYRKIYRLVRNKDWRLINNFNFRLDEKDRAHIDHLVFADKYIYCIVDKYWHGGVSGKENDGSWFFYPDKKDKKNKKEKIFIDNPLKIHNLRLEKFGLVTGLDSDVLVGIVVVNNSCTLKKLKQVDKNSVIVKLRKIKKTILEFESHDVGAINDEQLQKAVFEINKLKA